MSRPAANTEPPNTVRFAGKEYPVLDRLNIGRRNYLILKRLASAPRRRLLAFDPHAGPGGDLRAILILPRTAASRQHLRVLKAASANVNLPKIVDYHRHGDEWRLALEWITGPDLKTYLDDLRRRERARRPSAFEAFRLFRGLAHGLSQLHRRGMIHGDVHPGNLILTTNPTRVVPIDFGSAWQAHQTMGRAEGDGLHPAYAAPEIQNAAGFVDFRSDQFSATVILYELLTLTLPYDGLGGNAGRAELAGDAPTKYEPPSELSPNNAKLPSRVRQGIDRVAATGLAFTPDDRYLTPSAWLDNIDQFYRDRQPQQPLSPVAEGMTRVVNWLADRLRRR
jgi:serine/threonine protein kinase